MYHGVILYFFVHVSRAKCSFYRRWNWFRNEENDYKRGRGAGIGFGFAISFDLNSLRYIFTVVVCVLNILSEWCVCGRRLNRIDDDVWKKDNFQPFYSVAIVVSHCFPLFAKSLLHAVYIYKIIMCVYIYIKSFEF